MTPGLRGFPAVGGGHASGLHASFQAWRSEAPRMSCVTGVAVMLMRTLLGGPQMLSDVGLVTGKTTP